MGTQRKPTWRVGRVIQIPRIQNGGRIWKHDSGGVVESCFPLCHPIMLTRERERDLNSVNVLLFYCTVIVDNKLPNKEIQPHPSYLSLPIRCFCWKANANKLLITFNAGHVWGHRERHAALSGVGCRAGSPPPGARRRAVGSRLLPSMSACLGDTPRYRQ